MSGFFINSDGMFITNSHILKKINYPSLSPESKKDYTLTVDSELGKMRLDGARFVKCWPQSEIDLCILEVLNHKSKYFIPLTSMPSKLEYLKERAISLVGHCGKDFNIKTGKIDRYYEDFQSAKSKEVVRNVGLHLGSVQTEPSPCHGDSGGPVFESLTGKLRGIVLGSLEVEYEKKEYFFMLPSYEILKKVRGLNVANSID